MNKKDFLNLLLFTFQFLAILSIVLIFMAAIAEIIKLIYF